VGRYLIIGWDDIFYCPFLLFGWIMCVVVVHFAFVGFPYVVCLDIVTFSRYHLGGNVFDDVSTFVDVLFPKFELEWGGTT